MKYSNSKQKKKDYQTEAVGDGANANNMHFFDSGNPFLVEGSRNINNNSIEGLGAGSGVA
jgi:hypothetical protein